MGKRPEDVGQVVRSTKRSIGKIFIDRFSRVAGDDEVNKRV